MLRRAILILALVFAFVGSALATDVSVNSFSVPGYRSGGTTAKLRLYSSSPWTDSTGVPHLAGIVGSTTGFYQEINSTVVGSTLYIPQFVTASTIDALQNRTVLLTAVIFDSAGRAHEQLFSNWRIPNTPTPTTWAVLVAYNAGQPKPLGDTYATLAQVSAMIVAAINASTTSAASHFANGDTANACSPNDVFFRQADGHYYGCPTSNNPAQFLLAGDSINAANLINTPGLVGFVSPDSYGAIHDGSSHPLSSVYGTLAAAQAAYSGAYSFVTSLAQEIDYVAVKATSNAALGADASEHGVILQRLNRPIYLPAGTYFFGNDTWTIRDAAGVHIYGAGRTATKLQSNNTAFATDGLWYSHIDGIEFDTLTNSGIAAFDIDGNVPGHPYATRGVQGNTFKDLLFDGGGSTYATALCRLGQGGGQCSENTWENDHWINASEAAYYQIGANALHNIITGGDSQSYQKDGIAIVGGSVKIDTHAFESDYQYTQVANGGFDIHVGEFGVGERISVIGCRTESLQFVKSSATQPIILIGNSQTPSAVTVWQAAANYHVIGTEMLKQVVVGGSTVWRLFSLTTTGISGLVEPAWPPSGTITDGAAVWTQRTFYSVDTISISGDGQNNYAALNDGFLSFHFAGWADPIATAGQVITSSFTIARENIGHPQVTFNVDAALIDITITSPILANGQILILKKADTSSHTVSLAGTGGALVDGNASVSIPGGSQGWLTVQYSTESGGNNFNIIGSSNAKHLNGGTFSSPLPIGNVTPAAGTFTALTGTSLAITGTPISSSATGLLGAFQLMPINITTATVGTSATTFITSGATAGAGEVNRQIPMPACIIRNLRINIVNTTPAAGTVVITIRKNGVDTAVTKTITAGSTAAVFSDLTHSVTFTGLAGDNLLSISLVNNDASNAWTILGTSISYEVVRQ